MNERETRKIKTPSGREVILKEWITGREAKELRKVFLNAVELSASGTEIKSTNIKTSVIEEAENKALEMVVLSLDGDKENLIERLLDLPASDYQFIVAEVNKVTEGIAQKKTG